MLSDKSNVPDWKTSLSVRHLDRKQRSPAKAGGDTGDDVKTVWIYNWALRQMAPRYIEQAAFRERTTP